MIAHKMKQRWIDPEEYLRLEESAAEKSEYFNGEIFVMSGGSYNHDIVCGNIFASIHRYARQRKCTPFTNNMKILVRTNGLYTYPDAMLVCGKVEFSLGRSDTVTNPLLIVEVLSNSTQSYDRGDKFALYRGLESFAHYLLIHQDQAKIEYHEKTTAGWLLKEVVGVEATLKLISLDLEFPLDEIYAGVDWLPA